MKLLLKNALAFIEGGFVKRDVLISGGRIESFGEPCCSFDEILPIDVNGAYLVPGFIDIHTHGACGVDVNRANGADFQKLSDFYASKGVTAYLASVLTDSVDNTKAILGETCAFKTAQNGGAQLLGAHLEGPFLSAQKKGAMPLRYLQKGNIALLESFLETGCVKYITIAPEIEGGLELISRASKSVRVAIGHSAADYATGLQAIECGAKSATHTFNAMAGIDRVEPNILGAVLENQDVYNEIIADGKHVHPANIRMLYALKGNRKIVAITDSIEATGMPDGEYSLGANRVSVAAGEAFISGTNARAGSVLTMDNALKNLMRFLNIDLAQALPMLTENPADLFSLNKGYIRIGYDADLVILDQDLNVKATVIAGKYKQNEECDK